MSELCEKNLFTVFRRHYDRLVTVTRSCVIALTAKLYARNIISEEVHDEIIECGKSNREKASKLLLHVKNQVSVHPGKLLELIDVLKEEPSFDHITNDLVCKLLLPVLHKQFFSLKYG